MPGALTIALSTLADEEASPDSVEAQATLGLFTMMANGRLLTMIEDTDLHEFRHGPYLAGCPVAEWLVWNWWRLRWELGRPSEEKAARDWDFAHRMAAIGGGYAWPNVTIFSDGLLSFLVSEPSQESQAVLFPYVGTARPESIPAASLEAAIDGFAADVLARLDRHRLRQTNLHRLWNDLTAERQDPERACFRRLEAQLGCDPDETDAATIHRHLAGTAKFGEEAWGEVAADAALRGRALDDMMSAEDIADIARRHGFDADSGDAVAPAHAIGTPQSGEVEAWRVGYGIARAIRDRERLDGQPIPDARLAALAGTTVDALFRTYRRSDGLCFALDRLGDGTRLVLRSRWKTGRRFELARLLGDRLFSVRTDHPTEALFPATRTYSYRQRAQRAFAAELLSPFAAVDDMLADDLSEDGQTKAAKHFGVSPMTIRTQLVNHGRLGREDAPDIAGRGGWVGV